MKITGIAIAALMLLTALPLWTQQSSGAAELEQALQQLLEEKDWSPEELQKLLNEKIDWGREKFQDAELVSTCLAYAKDAAQETSPYEKIQLALSVMTAAQQMRALGFGEPQIIRTALDGTREVLAELAKLQQQRRQDGAETGAAELIRSRFEEQVHAAMKLDARHTVQARDRAERDSRPADLLVPPGPQGPAGPGH